MVPVELMRVVCSINWTGVREGVVFVDWTDRNVDAEDQKVKFKAVGEVAVLLCTCSSALSGDDGLRCL